MSSFLEIPQTPRAKKRFSDELEREDAVQRSSFADSDSGKGPDGQKRPSPYLDPDGFRRLSLSPFSETERLSPAQLIRALSPAPHLSSTRRSSVRQAWFQFWTRNKPLVLVFVAQLFAALMNLSARLLELDDEQKMHPFQLLFIRMFVTFVLSNAYMWWSSIPHYPLGAQEVRWLLVIRGLTGFFGLFGMWYSMMYIPLAEATVITFLVPSVAGYICHLTIRDPFTRREQIASYLALLGVILIARPTSLFSSADPTAATNPTPVIEVTGWTEQTTAGTIEPREEVTSAQRLTAIGVALLGVLGGSGAFTTIRAIGQRAHPLISVNYFSTWCLLVSTVTLTVAPILDIGQPALRFAVPHSLYAWTLLLVICMCGFATQILFTAGLGGERSNRAAAMVYTHMLFAAAFDKWVFGHAMGAISLIGCGLIIGSAMWVALGKKPAAQKTVDLEVGQGVAMETVPMLADDGDEEDNAMPLQEIR